MSKKRAIKTKRDAIMMHIVSLVGGIGCIGMGFILIILIYQLEIMGELFFLLPENRVSLIAAIVGIVVTFSIGTFVLLFSILRIHQDLQSVKKIKKEPDEDTIYF